MTNIFLYNLEGKLLVHPRRPELVGQNRWDYRDINGGTRPFKADQTSTRGRGFVQYFADKKLSTEKPALKLSYTAPLPSWGWVLDDWRYCFRRHGVDNIPGSGAEYQAAPLGTGGRAYPGGEGTSPWHLPNISIHQASNRNGNFEIDWTT